MNTNMRRMPQQRQVPRRIPSSGNARQHYERYIARAHEAQLAGDVVEMENCFQHAEHYFRILRGEDHGEEGWAPALSGMAGPAPRMTRAIYLVRQTCRLKPRAAHVHLG